MTPWSDIISRLEKLSGPDRSVDKAILLAVGWRIDKEAFGIASASEIWISPDGDDYDAVVDTFNRFPRPTASLDAARDLMPDGWRLQLFEHVTGKWSARVIGPGFKVIAPFETGDNPLERLAPTGPIALLIAICKARSSLSAPGEEGGDKGAGERPPVG